MIVVDTSALMAIVLGEPSAVDCVAGIAAHEEVLIASATFSECLVVAMGRKVERDMRRLLDELALAVIPLTAQRAHAAAEAYRRWGKGFNPAGLNICETFAYALAAEYRCPLLYIGNDFAKTDIVSALT